MPHFTEKAIAWIDQQKRGKPFFIYFAPVAVHGPETPSAATKGTSRAGIYGDWIHELDRSVGRLLDALDQRGLAKDTLVIFTSDNGGENRNFEKNSVAAIKLGLKMNGDWRNGKHSVFEGGLRVPFIARWPGHVPANTVSDEPICLVDTLATFAVLTGAQLPPAAQGAEDSFNILPAILGEKPSAPLRPALIGHSGWGVFSVRQGPWKWIEGKYAPAKQPSSEKNEFHPQLYNLADDPGETRDVIAEHPDVASKLSALLDAYRQQGHSRE
jgi:arylsulfatase A-like enzyme